MLLNNAGRDRLGRWGKGQSGNPAGRPRLNRMLREQAASHCDEALCVLLEVMRSRGAPAGARRQAARDLLRFALGRHCPPLREARELLALAGLTEFPDPAYPPPAAPPPVPAVVARRARLVGLGAR